VDHPRERDVLGITRRACPAGSCDETNITSVGYSNYFL
jgi:hypothetical protein